MKACPQHSTGKEGVTISLNISAMFSMMVLRMKACPQHSTGKEGVTISLNKAR
uniref:Tyrosine-specific transport protein n=1 Tax=Klebsiella pneumoniae TaxID=573 RepID=A0A6G9HXM0_KLEPN|nr:Tyrosine-specific transport protein [Klebsiella pneumoniae]QIQ15577.1 Tyrosine-specific transport protein [Klebsiella pneumoniae]QIQ15809.1 Tyrosine-specific transport protein [Klebsiella pneumoniae]QIQ16041.1 Tyrosine-specific transport protein [Klebsiella pneumoniae]